jgi:hypothetical protein
MTENKDHDKLFADLDALTEQQIEVGLAAGVWNEQVRPLVQHTSMTSRSNGSKPPLID